MPRFHPQHSMTAARRVHLIALPVPPHRALSARAKATCAAAPDSHFDLLASLRHAADSSHRRIMTSQLLSTSSSSRSLGTPGGSAQTTQQQRAQQMTSLPSQLFPCVLPAALHTCPGAGADDEEDEWQSDEDDTDASESESDEISASSVRPSLLPPLIPPFRFAMVECSRPVAVGGLPPTYSSSAAATPGGYSKSNKAGGMSSASSTVSLPSVTSLANLAAHSGSLQQLQSQQYVQSPGGQSLGLPTMHHAASVSISRSREERRHSLTGAGWPMPNPAASPSTVSTVASVPSVPNLALLDASQLPTGVLRQRSSNSSTASGASSGSNVSATAGLSVMPVPSPPTSPSRGLMSAVNGAASSVSASGSASDSARSAASHTGRHICLRGLADQTLYRGAYPTLKNFHFLTRLRLKTIISLTPEAPSADLKNFCREGGGPGLPIQSTTRQPTSAGTSSVSMASASESSSAVSAPPPPPPPLRIRLFHFPVPKWKENVCLSTASVIAVLQIITNAENLPAYVHCIDGCNNTSLLIACLRKMQGWTQGPILSEMLRFTSQRAEGGAAGGIIDAERMFLDKFNHHGILANPQLPGDKAAGGTGKDAAPTPSSAAGGGGGAGGAAGAGARGDAVGGGDRGTTPSNSAKGGTLVSIGGGNSTSVGSSSSNPYILLRVPLLLPSWRWR